MKQFMNHLNHYMQQPQENSGHHQWMTRNSTKMQLTLERYGIGVFTLYQVGNTIFRNYRALELLHYLRQAFSDRDNFSIEQHSNHLADVLISFDGITTEARKNILWGLINPLIWLREGIRAILGSPLMVLSSLGFLSSARAEKITGSRRFLLIASIGALVTLIGFAGTIIGILTDLGVVSDWGSFVQQLMGRF